VGGDEVGAVFEADGVEGYRRDGVDWRHEIENCSW
jgi:hypothetical protein